MAKTHKSLTEILDNSAQLQGLMAKAKRLEMLNNGLFDLLPDKLKGRCHIANLEKNQLVIAAENGTWATALKYETANLLSSLGEIAPEIDHIKVIVQERR